MIAIEIANGRLNRCVCNVVRWPFAICICMQRMVNPAIAMVVAIAINTKGDAGPNKRQKAPSAAPYRKSERVTNIHVCAALISLYNRKATFLIFVPTEDDNSCVLKK